jgi:hypothetical protein
MERVVATPVVQFAPDKILAKKITDDKDRNKVIQDGLCTTFATMFARWFLDGGVDLSKFQEYAEDNLDLAIGTHRFAISMFKIFDRYKYLKIDPMKAYDLVFNAFGVKGIEENFTPCSLAYFEPKPKIPTIHTFYHLSKATIDTKGAIITDRGAHTICHVRKPGDNGSIVTFDPSSGFVEAGEAEWNAWLQGALGKGYGFAANHMVIGLRKT